MTFVFKKKTNILACVNLKEKIEYIIVTITSILEFGINNEED